MKNSIITGTTIAYGNENGAFESFCSKSQCINTGALEAINTNNSGCKYDFKIIDK